jgi:NitT/TauT family transport system substrate-binding protein
MTLRPTHACPIPARFAALALGAALALSGCSLQSDASTSDGQTVRVVVGYQSKTINTVTAGTLLRANGYLEQRLAELGERTGAEYVVEWQDYDTGAPITAQMIAEKIDIGSMGDYPLLINGSRTNGLPNSQTELVSITAYNPRGALNMVVVRPDSPLQTISDLAGRKVSASVGSAGHGMLVTALAEAGIDQRVEVLNQQPQVGASALDGGSVDALSQFVAWPGLLVHQGHARLLYDGAELGTPTLHGVVARRAYTEQHPEVLDAFLDAQLDATWFLQQQPLEAARIVADNSGLPQEVVYLYNGPGGAAVFDPAVKESLVQALHEKVPYLQSIGDFAPFDIDSFVNDSYLKETWADRAADSAPNGAPDYAAALEADANPTAVHGRDPVCGTEVTDPATAGEVWLDGRAETQPAATPTCLLRAIKQAQESGAAVRASYIPDAELGTRWFADKSVWVLDPAAGPGARFQPFTTAAAAGRYTQSHPGARVVPFAEAVAQS